MVVVAVLLNNIKLRDLRIHPNKQKCISSLIPVNPSFYVYIILNELNIIASYHNSLKKNCYMLKYENLT